MEPLTPEIARAEVLDNGVMVTFKGGIDIFFPASFLYNANPPAEDLPVLVEDVS